MGNVGYESFERTKRHDEIIKNMKVEFSDMVKLNNQTELNYVKKDIFMHNPMVRYETFYFNI